MNILSLFSLLLVFLFIYYLFKKTGLLNENVKYSIHKNFGKTNDTPIILGGVYLIIVILLFFKSDLFILKISLVLIFFIGLLSDKNILPSPRIRIILQILVLFFLVFYSELQIKNLENFYLNNFLNNNLINLFFTVFCFAILINGSNFIDGLNGLLSGYFLLTLFSIIYVCYINEEILFIYEQEVLIIFSCLLIFFIFNILGKVYLGDGGSYLLATLIGFYLVEFVYSNSFVYISPYYVASILWYPSFENLFSISRRILKNNNVSSPDNKHLHQSIFLFIKSKRLLNDKYLNSASSIIILIFNIPTFILSSLMATYSQGLVLIIVINMLFYILIYNFISNKIKIKK